MECIARTSTRSVCSYIQTSESRSFFAINQPRNIVFLSFFLELGGSAPKRRTAGLLLLEAHALLKRRKGFVNSRDAVLGFCRLFREPPGSAVSEHFNALFLTHKSVFHCFLYDGLQIPFPGSTSTAPRKAASRAGVLCDPKFV